ncbi:hypothetical protein ACH5RR_002799 [Cinchona calisaya]|uniref:Fe2OG dioxygenase domain-containing protein n=1 Tax=Cinchona calisaya TaxID=153742 RepID=A0ABD3AT04_9GENT
MESDMLKFGSSLKVPYVQELAKEKFESVPPRYTRPDATKINRVSAKEIPVIDMQALLNSEELVNTELEKLDFACKEWGFFQLINHGVSCSLVEKLKSETQKFFNLSMDEKMKFGQQPGDVEGYGQAFVLSDEQKLDWADVFAIFTLPTHLRKPHLLPKLPVPFRETIEEYSLELRNLAVKLLNQMAKALGMKLEDMTVLFEEGIQSMRMNYYPPCPQPEMVTGLCPHSDGVGLTILLQVNEVEGLQIKKDGAWIPVMPLPNAFVVNVGDIIEIVTNGIYKSIEHRVTVNMHIERISIATFLLAKLDGDIGPAPSLITPTTPANFRRIDMVDYLRKIFARELDGKSFLDAMRI